MKEKIKDSTQFGKCKLIARLYIEHTNVIVFVYSDGNGLYTSDVHGGMLVALGHAFSTKDEKSYILGFFDAISLFTNFKVEAL